MLESINQWNAKLYDEKLHYVSQYGRRVIELLAPQKDEYIVDLGCGTGDLTKEIAHAESTVVGIDASKEMIIEAKNKYPNLDFIRANANHFRLEKSCHAVFSNAALHWMTDPEKVIESVYQALLPGGRFVAEFGGKNNISVVIDGILNVLTNVYRLDEKEAKSRVPWYFPSIGEYSQLLEAAGFRVTYAHHFDRPTLLPGGEEGMTHWLDSFADDFFAEFSKPERMEIYELVKDQIRPRLFEKGNWVVDYKRLQVIAVK